MSVIEEFIKVKKSIDQPKKDSTNPQFKSGYVSLDGVISSVDNAIKDSNANLVWWQEIVEGVVNTVLSDGSGEPLKIPGFPLLAVDRNKSVSISQASPQALGSGLTYAKRYSLATAFGISSDVDDDGNHAQNGAVNKGNQQQPKQPEITLDAVKTTLNDLVKKTNGDYTKISAYLLKQVGADNFNALSSQQLFEANDYIKQLSDKADKK